MNAIGEQQLIDFERRVVQLFEEARIPYPIHLSGGNEAALIALFAEVEAHDYVFSTHRSHYHYLLKGGAPERLERMILAGESMHIFDEPLRFLSSSIVAGTVAMAAGVALGLKRQGAAGRVWCFVGDGAEDEGHFYEAVRYVDGHGLPCTFVIEDNDRSVETPAAERYGGSRVPWPECVRRYTYRATYPHVGTGTGNIIRFGDRSVERSSF